MSTLKYLLCVLLFMFLAIIPTLFGNFGGLQIIWGIICLILCPPLVITIILLLTNTKWKKIAGISLIITLLWVGVVYKFAKQKETESSNIVEEEKIEEDNAVAIRALIDEYHITKEDLFVMQYASGWNAIDFVFVLNAIKDGYTVSEIYIHLEEHGIKFHSHPIIKAYEHINNGITNLTNDQINEIDYAISAMQRINSKLKD